MTPPTASELPIKYDFSRFKRLCRAELKKLGVEDLRFKVSAATGALQVIIDLEKLSPAVEEKVLNRLFELIDEYDVPAAPVPASYYRYHVG